jgi:methyl-accepting chemotaxis protein
MDETTQQNAALVEQAAAAAESLQDQAASLSQAVAVFKTSGGRAVAPASVGRNPRKEEAGFVRAEAQRLRSSAASSTVSRPRPAAPGPVRAMQRNAAQANANSEDEWEEF